MKEFQEKLTATASLTVDENVTAKTVKSGSLDVFGTPVLLALMEEATCNCVAPILDDGETTVGISVTVSHDKASGLGEKVTATAVLEKAEGRKLTFSVSAVDSVGDVIGKGTIERFVVISEKFMSRVKTYEI